MKEQRAGQQVQKKKKLELCFVGFFYGEDGVQRDSGLLLKFSLHNLA